MTVRDIQLVNGVVLRNVPGEITDGGALDMAVQRGILSADEAAQTLQIATEAPETGGTLNEVAIGAGKFFADRIPGLDNSIAAPDTLAASIGYALPGIAASFAVPGSILAQAGIGSALELARKGSTLESTLTAGALQGGGAGVGNLASRVFRGIGQARQGVQQTLGQRTGSTILQRIEAGLQAGGGFDTLKRETAKQINRSLAKTIGQQADNLSPAVLSKAADDIGSIFEAIIPKRRMFNIGGTIRTALDKLDIGERAARALPDIDDITGADLNAIRTALTARIRTLAGDAPGVADDLALVVDDIDDLIAREVGDDVLPLLRIAREGWKNLKIIESLPSVRATGNATARQLTGKLAGKQGYGSSYIRDTGSVLPDTQDMFDIARSAARLADIVGDSGTATRIAALGGMGAVAGYVKEGDVEGALIGAAAFLAPAVAGRLNVGLANAALGQASTLATKLGGAGGAGVSSLVNQ